MQKRIDKQPVLLSVITRGLQGVEELIEETLENPLGSVTDHIQKLRQLTCVSESAQRNKLIHDLNVREEYIQRPTNQQNIVRLGWIGSDNYKVARTQKVVNVGGRHPNVWAAN